MSALPRNEACAGCRWMRNSNTARGVAECSIKNLQVDSTAPGKSRVFFAGKSGTTKKSSNPFFMQTECSAS